MNNELTKREAKVTSRVIEFSLGGIVERLIPAFPSCTFECVCRDNGGVTTDWRVKGPSIWVDKIERRYGY